MARVIFAIPLAPKFPHFTLDKKTKNPHDLPGFRPSVIIIMNPPRKNDRSPTTLVLTKVCRFWCALAILWMLVPTASADDFGLSNPAEKDFAEFKSDTSSPGTFARKTPTFTDRTMPPPQNTGVIRQVSTDESAHDPFSAAAQLTVPQTPPVDWSTASPMVQDNHLMAQNNLFPYIAAQNMYPTGENPYFSQFPQYPQQYQQGYMMEGMNPYADMYAPYGYIDPYAMGYQPAYPMEYQNTPDYSSLYQAVLFQEIARQQAEAGERRNREKEADDIKKQADSTWTLNNLVPVRVTSPLGETMFACAKTVSPFVSPTGPDKGVGMPLVGKSWLDHPYYLGGFVGSISGSELVSEMIEQKSGGTGGLTFGYNFNDYWGLESRLHFASIDIKDTDQARKIIEDVLGPGVIPLWTTRSNELTILDAAVHYYLLGNAKWRPYFKYGLGVGQQNFVDIFGQKQSSDIITMPLGAGVRYWWNERLAIQADLVDNVIFSSGNTKTQNNFAFTVGITYAFGTGKKNPPVHYWPATPSMGTKW